VDHSNADTTNCTGFPASSEAIFVSCADATLTSSKHAITATTNKAKRRVIKTPFQKEPSETQPNCISVSIAHFRQQSKTQTRIVGIGGAPRVGLQ
jgi:hypothetical protein